MGKLTAGKDAMGLQLVLGRVWKKVGLEGASSEKQAAAQKQWEAGCVETTVEMPKEDVAEDSAQPLTQELCEVAKKLTAGKDAMGLQLVMGRVWKKVGLEGASPEKQAAAQKQWEAGCPC